MNKNNFEIKTIKKNGSVYYYGRRGNDFDVAYNSPLIKGGTYEEAKIIIEKYFDKLKSGTKKQ